MGLINLFKTFTKGQENAQDQLNENFAKLEDSVQDTGWVQLTLNSGYEHASGLEVEIRKIGKDVELRGCVAITNPSAPQGAIGNIPEEFRPSKQISWESPYRSSSQLTSNLIYVYTNGQISIIRSAPSGGTYNQLFTCKTWKVD